MILFRLFFFIISLFFGLSLLLGALGFLRLRYFMKSPFLSEKDKRCAPHGDNIIEGQYEVIDDSTNDSAKK